MSEGQHWGIVGGGMLGLTLALRLAQQGKRVTVLEGADHLGGLAAAWRLNDVVWDRHYHVTLLSDLRLRAVLAELDLEAGMEWVETRTGCYAGGRHYSVSNTLELLRFPVLGLFDTLRLGATVFYASRIRDGRRLEHITVSDWLRRWSGRRAFERFWLPLLRSKLGDSYRDTSAAFIWATIARLYAARRSGLKKEMFGYVPGGYRSVLEQFPKLLARHGGEVRLGQRVERVVRSADGVRVEMGEAGAETSTEIFDRVAVTVAAPVAAHLCPDLEEAERDRLARIRYQGIVCASLLLRQPLKGFYVTNLLDGDMPFTGVIEMSALVDRERYLDGHHLVYLPRYLAADDPFFSLPDEEIESQFVTALLRMYPHLEPDDILAFRLSRVRMVHPLTTLGYSDDLPTIQTSVPGLYLVSSANIVNGTLNVNETVTLAERAAEELRNP